MHRLRQQPIDGREPQVSQVIFHRAQSFARFLPSARTVCNLLAKSLHNCYEILIVFDDLTLICDIRHSSIPPGLVWPRWKQTAQTYSIGNKGFLSRESMPTIAFATEKKKFKFLKANLKEALAAGVSLYPESQVLNCRHGVCGSCRVLITKGRKTRAQEDS